MTKEERQKLVKAEADETGLPKTLYKVVNVASRLANAADDLALITEYRSKLNKELYTGMLFNNYYRLQMLMDEVLYLHNIESWDTLENQVDNVYKTIDNKLLQSEGGIDDNT